MCVKPAGLNRFLTQLPSAAVTRDNMHGHLELHVGCRRADGLEKRSRPCMAINTERHGKCFLLVLEEEGGKKRGQSGRGDILVEKPRS